METEISSPLHAAKNEAHRVFDFLWESGGMTRTAAYRFLAQRMGLPAEACHISKFTVDQCARVVQICKPFEALERKV